MAIHLFRPVVCQEAIDAVAEVLKSGWTGLGPKTRQFEQEFAKYVHAKHCTALNSCTSALHLALHLLDLQPKDEVISTPLTFVSTNHAILYEGATPVFADVQLETGCIDPTDVESKITANTKAIICVHYGGYPCDLDELHRISRDYSVPIIEDCAHAAGATYKGRHVGSISTLNCFSFHSVKNLSIADGGAITTNNRFYHERLERLRWLGIDKSTFKRTEMASSTLSPSAYAWRYDVCEVGFKTHMNDVMAAIGLEQLKKLDEENARRAEIAEMYTEGLKGIPGLTLLKREDDRQSANHLFVIRAEGRDRLIDHLKKHDIHPGVHYIDNSSFSVYKKANVPHAEQLERELISLPLHLMLTDDDVQLVIETIRKGW